MQRWRSSVAPVLVLVLVAGASARVVAAEAGDGPPGPYAVTDLGALEPGGSVGPLAVDDAGRVVGVASVGTSLRAFLHDGSVMRELPPLPGHTESSATDLSDTGVAVGSSSAPGGVDTGPVRWDGTTPSALPRPAGATGGVAIGIDDGGSTVVGSVTSADGTRTGVRWRDGTVEVLDDVLPLPEGATVEAAVDVDDAGRMVGRLWSAAGEPVAFWFDGESVHLVRDQPGVPADAVAFGPAGVLATAADRAFLWHDGQTTALPALPGDACTAANDVDDDGRAVGRSSACGRDPTPRAVLWQGGRAVDLQTLLPAGTGLRLTDARAVSGGRIAATAVAEGGAGRAVLLRPRPSLEAFAGADPVAVAGAVAATVSPGRRAGAVVAAAASPADVAVAAVLAADRRAPLLLNGSTALDPRVVDALAARTTPGATVELVGGTAALAASVDVAVAALGHPVVRHAGADRYGTAVRVAEATGGPGRIVLASAEAFDAPAAIPLAIHERAALLWTDGPSLPDPTRTYLEARPGWPRTAIGRAVGAVPTAVGVRGADRSETSVLVAEASFPWPPLVTVAPASRPVDGALAASVAAAGGGPVLVAFDRLPARSGNYLAGLPFLPAFRTVGAVDPAVAEQLAPFTG